MTFHIVEVIEISTFSESLESVDTTETANVISSSESPIHKRDGTDIEYTVSIGVHIEKERPALLVKGSDSYIFSWLDSFVSEGGFTTTVPMNFEPECVLCNSEPKDGEVYGSPNGIMFYESEVSESMVSDVSMADFDFEEFSDADRVWSVSPPRFKMEDIVSQHICARCNPKIAECVREILQEDGEDLVRYLL